MNDGGRSIDEAVAPFLGQMNVTHVAQKHSGPAAARNAGVTRRYTAFTDDDCRPYRGWLTELERCLTADDSVLVGGRVINTLEDNACSATSQPLVTYLYAYYNPNRELCDRWIHSGRRMVYAETALIRHSHWLSLRSFWRQHFQYGQGALRYWQGKAQRDADHVRVEPLRFYTGLLQYPWTVGVRQPLRIAALLFIAQMASAMGFFREKFLGSGTPSPFTMKATMKPPCS